ncbi:MAG: hypothetical protein US52_C0064G0006 [candidate division WS6 bacterium GW2011_GWA2_37_6]|uniref:Uncharacterized protein n=1 Tax=candidate division WS6 bacterium GW2011_GWA2_37_6 TaxID=1619087 RepID=A0A0G0JC03_9BACT|nr:MAG: hypothetical protein US52_C0064G0006 [candidate division WS6 bacterium GW2011_GWA2_37_6]
MALSGTESLDRFLPEDTRNLLTEMIQAGDGYKYRPVDSVFTSSRDPDWKILMEEKPLCIDDIWPQYNSGQSQFIQMSKTGSELYGFVVGPLNGVIINRIRLESALVWKSLVEGESRTETGFYSGYIPVAPILQDKNGRSRFIEEKEITYPISIKAIVFSRFCGLNMQFVIRQLNQLIDSLPVIYPHDIDVQIQEGYASDSLRERGRSLWLEIDSRQIEIFEQLDKLRIQHGHPHIVNWTVEFCDKNYYEEHILSGGNVNNIPYDEEAFSFNPRDKILYPERYVTIVRLIDLDRALQKS